MEAAWRFRLMLFTAFALIMFGDFFGFGYGGVRGVKTAGGRSPTTFRENQPDLDIIEDNSVNQLSTAAAAATTAATAIDAIDQRRKQAKIKLAEAIKESCLPKMLCEMSSKPQHLLSDKEKDLLQLIRSTSMSLAMNSPPSRWHFAAHMGELFRHTSDALSGPIACANLWPQCPFSSKKLMSLTYKVNLK